MVRAAPTPPPSSATVGSMGHGPTIVLVQSARAPQMTKPEADSLLAMFDRDWQGTLHMVYASFGRDSAQGEALWAEASQVERVNMRAWIPVALSTDLTDEAAALKMPV